ncbi:LIM domain-containing protein unc-97 [Entamoeba marina]
MTEEQINNLKKGETLEIPQPDGTVIIIEGNPCVRCQKNIVGELVETDEGPYHPECFTCAECECDLLQEEDYCEEDGEVYCSDCHTELFEARCYYCKQPIEDTAIQFNNRKYHPHHFGCCQCKLILKGKPYKDIDGEPHCLDCAAKKAEEEKMKDLCFICKEPIIGDYVLVNGMKCHSEHYKCSICNAEFSGGNSIEYLGKRYCLPCYRKVSLTFCEKCKHPIEGRSIQACGFLFHVDCFRCTECDLPLTGSTFFRKDGKPYCNYHFYRLFGKVCEKCGEVIEGDDGYQIKEKFYHKKCFVCSQCNKKLDPKKTKVYEGNPICLSCYNRLPGDVKYALDQEEYEQERIEGKRKRETKKENKEDLKAQKKREKEIKKQLKEAKKQGKK